MFSKQKKLYMHLLYVILLPVFLVACGGGGGGGDGNRIYPNYLINVTSSASLSISSFSVEEADDYVVFSSSLTIGNGIAYEPVPMYLFYSYLQYTSPLLKLPLTLSNTWSGPGKFSQSGWTHSSVVSSVSESVVAGGVVYNNCVKITTTITGDGMDASGNPASNEVNTFVRGSRDVWFAPGVGPVKMAYNHENGYVTTGELQSYTLAVPSSSYFPLAVGNQWSYRWINGYRTSFVTEVYTVDKTCAGQTGDCRL